MSILQKLSKANKRDTSAIYIMYLNNKFKLHRGKYRLQWVSRSGFTFDLLHEIHGDRFIRLLDTFGFVKI